MGYKALTEQGKTFIREVCKKNLKGEDISNSNTLLQGNAPEGHAVTLPFSSVANENPPRIWKSNAKYNGKSITTNSELAEALIFWFNNYATVYELDANIVAAQAYQESRFNIWIYNAKVSTASGIAQFTYSTAYDIMILNNYDVPKFSDEEIAIFTNGLDQPMLSSSWKVGSDNLANATRSRNNRTIFHQTLIDNPHLNIKAQCRLLKFIVQRNCDLASVSLFLYSRGSGFHGLKTYTDAINHVKNNMAGGDAYIKEGLNIVKNIFGYLGDQNNEYGLQSAKPKGIWFGYKELNLKDDFDPYQAQIKDSNRKFPSTVT